MDRVLRPVVAGLTAARLRPDALAMLVVVSEFGGRNARLGKRAFQAKLGQFPDRMRQHVDADTQRPWHGNGFEHPAIHTNLVQAEGGRQPADAAADNQDGHWWSVSIDARRGIVAASVCPKEQVNMIKIRSANAGQFTT